MPNAQGLAAAALCALALLLAACEVLVDSSVAVRTDGSAEFEVVLAAKRGQLEAAEIGAEEFRDSMLAGAGLPGDAEALPYDEGEWTGLIAAWRADDAGRGLRDLAAAPLFGRTFERISLTRTADGGWRFEADLAAPPAEAEDLLDLDEGAEGLIPGVPWAEAILGTAAEMYLRLSLPGPLLDHNAVLEEDGTLHWRLSPGAGSLFAVSGPDGGSPPGAEPPERPAPPAPDGTAPLARMSVNAGAGPAAVATRYEFVFRNDAPSGFAEGRVVFPLPRGSTVSDLELAGGTETLEGRLLPAGEAAALYEEIVRRLVDPALLRSLGGDLYEVRAFPVPAGEARSVRFRVVSPLEIAAGEVLVEAPWQGMSPLPRAASVRVEADLPFPIRAAFAPGFALDVRRDGPSRLSASWESPPGWDAGAAGFRLRLLGGEGIAAPRLFSYRERGEDGYFALAFAPPLPAGAARAPRDVVFVLDRSGSMEGDKFAQALAAADELLDGLREDDRFGVVAFAGEAATFGGELRPATGRGGARAWLAGLTPAGGTNIEAALTAALSMLGRERPGVVVFLTDGLPTAGDASAQGILAAAERAAPPGRAQVFAFGVGHDVDTALLDSLSARFAGSSHYVQPGERIDDAVGALARRIATPVLTDVRIGVEGVEVSALAPAKLRGLFAGEAALLTGRYSGSGEAVVRVSGMGAGGPLSEEIAVAFPRVALADPAIARLWAQRRIAGLLTDLRLGDADEAAVAAIVAIANRFGIVTPYTSWLAEEPELVFEPERAAERVGESAAERGVSGADAVAAAAAVGALRDDGDAAPPSPGGGGVRFAGAHAWYERAEGWVRDDWRGEPAREVIAGSGEFARLIGGDPALATAAAVGERVVTLGPGGWIAIAWPPPGEAPPPAAAATATAAPPSAPPPPAAPATGASAPDAPAAQGATPETPSAEATPAPPAQPSAAATETAAAPAIGPAAAASATPAPTAAAADETAGARGWNWPRWGYVAYAAAVLAFVAAAVAWVAAPRSGKE